MAKRFTDTDIWNDPWFRKLTPESKLIWKFICDRCDSAGFWKKDFDLAQFMCGFSIEERHLAEINQGKTRIIDHEDHIQVVDFIQFQYGKLSADCKPHKSIIALWKHYEEKGYVKGMNTLQDKDKDKDKDKNKEELPVWLNKDAWNLWVNYRSEIKKKLTERTRNLQLKFLELHKTDHKKIIENSIMNGWTGLFPLKQTKGYGSPIQNDYAKAHEKRIQADSEEREAKENEKDNVVLQKIREQIKLVTAQKTI